MTIALGRVTAAESESDRLNEIRVLVKTAVGLAKTMSGRSGERRSRTRSMFYELVNDRQLKLSEYVGDYGDPREYFNAASSENDRSVVELAQSETVLFVKDLDLAPPAYFSNPRGRPYKSLISVPVRAGDLSFGVLMLDSEYAGALTDVDIAYAIHIAGLLGAGLAMAVPTVDVSVKVAVAAHLEFLADMPAALTSAFALDLARSAASFDLVPEADRDFLSGSLDLQKYSSSIYLLAESRVRRRLNDLTLHRVLAHWVRPRSLTRPAS